MKTTTVLTLALSALLTICTPVLADNVDDARAITPNIVVVNASAEYASEEQRQSVLTAFTYLQGSQTARVILSRFVTLRHTVYIVVNSSHANFFRTKGNYIAWDPTIGVRYPDGSAASPALVLLHELAHALRANENFSGFALDTQSKNHDYDNSEEMRVIKFVETPAANELHEGIRTNHNGRLFIAIAPNSTEAHKTEVLSLADVLGGH